MSRRSLMAVLAGLGTMPLAGCGLMNPTASYRFRMTAHVATPEGEREGSGVFEVLRENVAFRLFAEERAGGTALFGEAIAIDLPTGSPLFVLLEPPDLNGGRRAPLHVEVTGAFRPDVYRNGAGDYLAAVRAVAQLPVGTTAELPATAWPLLVRFDDFEDPASVRAVEPESSGLARLFVTTTRERPAPRLAAHMPAWFERYAAERRRLDGDNGIGISSSALAANLSVGSFIHMPIKGG